MLSLPQLRVATRPLSLAAAPENVLPDEVILEYVLAEPALYCLALSRRPLCYSSTKMFFFAQISFRTFGHTVTLTSPR